MKLDEQTKTPPQSDLRLIREWEKHLAEQELEQSRKASDAFLEKLQIKSNVEQ